MYSRKEFAETAYQRGYASKGVIAQYIKDNPKGEYTEEDLVECYRLDDRKHRQQDEYGKISGYSYRKSEEEKMQEKRDTWF